MEKLKKKLMAKILNWNFKKIAIIFIGVCLVLGIGSGGVLYSNFGNRLQAAERYIEKADKDNQKGEKDKKEDRSKQKGEEDKKGESSEQKGEGDGKGEYSELKGHEQNHEDTEIKNILEITDRDEIVIGIIGMVLGLLGCAYWLLVFLWILQKTHKYGANPVLFGILTLVFNLGGVIAFFIYKYVSPKCMKCGMIQKKDQEYCVNCGEPMYKECGNCKAHVGKDDKYCSKCGKEL